MSDSDALLLENQLCFPLYAASRLLTREYQPLLEELDLTYPQYLVLLVLWEEEGLPVNEIAAKLFLNTNTLTPLLKRMEEKKLIAKKRSRKDERKVLVTLSPQGRELQAKAEDIPGIMAGHILEGSYDLQDLIGLKDRLTRLCEHLTEPEEADLT